MRVCHVCSGHSVDDVRVFHRACVSLSEAGYEVHLIATGEARKAYRKLGVTIHPLEHCQNRFQRFARRSQIAQMAADLKPDVFHVHEPELLGAVIACADSRPVVWDVHESYLDVLSDREWIPHWLRPPVRFAWDRRERQLVRRCAAVVVVTERIAKRYRRFHENVFVVGNYPDFKAMETLPGANRDGKTCVFAGLLHPDRGLAQVLQAIAILKERGLRVPLKLAGRAVSAEYLQSLMGEVGRLSIQELVEYHGVLTKEDAIAFQHTASIGLIPYLPVANTMASMANKLAECMALGLPLVFSNFANYREIAGLSGAGIAVDPTNPEEIARAIDCLVRNPSLAVQMGEAGRRSTRERFNWGVERVKLLKLYDDLRSQTTKM